MNQETSQKILEEIEKKKIKMRPAGWFLFCSFFWLILSGIFFLSSIFWGAVFFHQLFVLKGMYFLDKNLHLFFLSFPYFPLLFLLGFIFLAIVAYRRGRMVCHHENWLLFFLLSLTGLLSGALWLEWSRQSENAGLFFRQGQLVEQIIFSPDRFWLMPEKGTLKGEFVSFDQKTGKMLIFSQTGEAWTVKTKGCSCHDRIPSKKGVRIHIFGLQEKESEKTFQAKQIWEEE